MSLNRLIHLVTAAAMSAIQWAALFSAPFHTQSLRPVSPPFAVEAVLPVVVITAHRNSQHAPHRHYLAGDVGDPRGPPMPAASIARS